MTPHIVAEDNLAACPPLQLKAKPRLCLKGHKKHFDVDLDLFHVAFLVLYPDSCFENWPMPYN